VNIVKLAEVTRAYRAELDRFDRLQGEGKQPHFNKKILNDYFEAGRETRFA
jgi:hypothetical protein